MVTGARPSAARRPVLYQLCRTGERFELGEGPVDLLAEPRPFEIGRREGDETRARGRIPVDDPWMSARHARVVDGPRGRGTATMGFSRPFLEDAGSRNGVVVNGLPLERGASPLLPGDLVETGRTFWTYLEEPTDDPLLSAPVEFGGIATWSPRFGRELKALQARVSSDEHVYVYGADGVGKGFLGRTLHGMSRREGRFLALDCRERRPRRIALELFGSDTIAGKLREAAGGTLLLEHVEALPTDVQDRLADALLRRTFAPDGRTRTIEMRARIVATTTFDPQTAARTGALRPALAEALPRIELRVPSLDERPADFGLLLDEFLVRAKGAPRMSREACRALLRASLRQNVRALSRIVEAAASLAADRAPDAGGGCIEITHLPLALVGAEAFRTSAQARELALGVGVGVDLTSEAPAVTSETGADLLPTSSPSTAGASRAGFVPPSDDVTHHAPGFEDQATDAEMPSPFARGRPRAAPVDVDAETLQRALRAHRGNVAAAARMLGAPRAQLIRWIRDLAIDPAEFT